MLISSDGIIIRIPIGGEHGIRLCARPSKGVRVMKINEGERLITAVSVPAEEGAEYNTEAVEDAEAPEAETEE